MKKTLLIILLACVSISSFSQKKKKERKLTLEEQVAIAKIQEQQAKEAERPLAKVGAKLPAFNVLTSKDQLFFDTSAAKNKPLILALFNPGCDHCMMAAKEFYANLARFKDATVLFVTGNNLFAEMKNFVAQARMNLDGIDNFVVSADNSDVTKNLFLGSGIPQVMIYNKDKILQKVFFQNINIDSVVYYMNQ